jgi:DNA-directed RNA polymerase specialized sigma24 family protein
MAVVRLLQTGSVREVSDQSCAMVLLSTVMRNVVVDVARRETAQKRGGDRVRLSVSLDALASEPAGLDVILLDDSMRALAEVDAQCAKVIELRIWGGLRPETVAEVLELSPGRVRTLWNRGKAFLAADLREREAVVAKGGE